MKKLILIMSAITIFIAGAYFHKVVIDRPAHGITCSVVLTSAGDGQATRFSQIDTNCNNIPGGKLKEFIQSNLSTGTTTAPRGTANPL